MPSLASRKASICCMFSFSASCTLVVNPQHAICSRLILYWKLPPPSGLSCIVKDSGLTLLKIRGIIILSCLRRKQVGPSKIGSPDGCCLDCSSRNLHFGQGDRKSVPQAKTPD